MQGHRGQDQQMNRALPSMYDQGMQKIQQGQNMNVSF